MNKKKQIIRLTESDLHRIVKESVKKVLRESILDEIDLQVEPQRYGQFWLRDKNTWIEFTAEVWVDRAHLECIVDSNDARGKQMCNSKDFIRTILHTILRSDSRTMNNIQGLQEFIDEEYEEVGDYDEIIHQLDSNIDYF